MKKFLYRALLEPVLRWKPNNSKEKETGSSKSNDSLIEHPPIPAGMELLRSAPGEAEMLGHALRAHPISKKEKTYARGLKDVVARPPAAPPINIRTRRRNEPPPMTPVAAAVIRQILEWEEAAAADAMERNMGIGRYAVPEEIPDTVAVSEEDMTTRGRFENYPTNSW